MAKIFNIDRLIDAVLDYLKVKADILKLDIIERISALVAVIISFLIIFIGFLFFIAFASLTIGSLLNQILESSYLGYAIVTTVYFILLMIVVYYLRSGKMQNTIESIVVRAMEKTEEDDSDG